MKLEKVVSGATAVYSERVVLIDNGNREVYRGYAPPFEPNAEGFVVEEFEFQGKVFALAGESMGAKLFKRVREAEKPPVPTGDESKTAEDLLAEADEKLKPDFVRLPLKEEYKAAGYPEENYDAFIKARTAEAAERGLRVEVRDPTPAEAALRSFPRPAPTP